MAILNHRSIEKLRSTASLIIICGLVGLATSCGLNRDQFKRQEELVRPLVQRRAAKEEVVAAFGTNYIFYSKNQTNWQGLASYLEQEPLTAHAALRERVAKWPNVLFYTTQDMMTWIFLDKDQQAVDFLVGAQ